MIWKRITCFSGGIWSEGKHGKGASQGCQVIGLSSLFRVAFLSDYVIMESTKFLEAPVFICGAPRSGTTLLSNLLDSHPQLLVQANETHLLTLFFITVPRFLQKRFFMSEYLDHHDIAFYSQKECQASFNSYLEKMYGAKWDFLDLDGSIFLEKYKNFILEHGITLKSLYQAMAYAYHCYLRKNGQPKYFVEKRPLDPAKILCRKKTFRQ